MSYIEKAWIGCKNMQQKVTDNNCSKSTDRISNLPQPILGKRARGMGKRARLRDDDGSKSMDRISVFPQPILHHILSFLSPKNAVQTCVLSKSWRHVWSARPNIELRESFFTGNKETFLTVLDKTLQRYHDQKLCIREFLVEMSEVDSESISLLEKWIPMVTLNNKCVSTFILYFLSENSAYFDLPSIVFQAESLQKLYLRQCKLNQINTLDKVFSKHLLVINLVRVYIADETFKKIMSSCPLIEYVVLDSCKGLRKIKVNKTHNLKGFDFRNHVYGEEDHDHCVEIEATTLEHIIILGCPSWFHRHMYFPHLSYLYLQKFRLCSKSFDLLSCNLPSLENWTLLKCYGFEEFQLSNLSIRRLTIWGMDRSVKATIDAPKVATFDYEGKIPPSISFTSTSCTDQWKSNIHLWFDVDVDIDCSSSSWFHKLSKLLDTVSRSEITLNLFQHCKVNNDDEQLIHDRALYNKPVVVVVVEHVNFSLGGHSCSSLPPFLNCLFRVCRPRYVGQYLYTDPLVLTKWERERKQLTEFLRKILVMERETRRYLWQQDLEKISLEAFNKNGKEWNPVQGSTGNRDRAQEVRFRLKWK